MAEFIEIAKINKRMCNKHEGYCVTNKCPLSFLQTGKELGCGELMKEYPEEYERICLEWAKENPEITNADKLHQIVKEAFGEGVATKIMQSLESERGCFPLKCTDLNCEKCKNNGFWNKTYVAYVEPKGE